MRLGYPEKLCGAAVTPAWLRGSVSLARLTEVIGVALADLLSGGSPRLSHGKLSDSQLGCAPLVDCRDRHPHPPRCRRFPQTKPKKGAV
jgi:hypothetical protein